MYLVPLFFRLVYKICIGLVMGSIVIIWEECVGYVLNISNFIVIIKVVVIVIHIIIGHYHYFFIFFMGLLPFVKYQLPSAGLVDNIFNIGDILCTKYNRSRKQKYLVYFVVNIVVKPQYSFIYYRCKHNNFDWMSWHGFCIY